MPTEDYFHPKDRNNRVIRNRYTSERVETALKDYIGASNECKAVVAAALINLSERIMEIEGGLDCIVECGYVNLIAETVIRHISHVKKKGWEIPDVDPDTPSAVKLLSVFPYWMPKPTSVPNDVEANGMCALTAPNMSGKSTLMRSVAAATLLATAGLYAPVGKGSKVGEIDSIFVRGASSDIPSENKSAFGAEMEEISTILNTCSSKSLVFVDEICFGLGHG